MTVRRYSATLLCCFSNIVAKNIVSPISTPISSIIIIIIINVPQISTIISLHNRWELVVDAIVYYAYKRS